MIKKFVVYNIVFLSTLFVWGNSQLKNCIGTMFINDNPPLIVDWTEKAGCTLVWMMLLDNYGLLEKAIKYHPWIHYYRMKIYSKKHKITPDRFLDPKYCKVKFVRNPYNRAVSSYLYCCKKYFFKGSFEDFLISLKNQKWKNLTQKEILGIKGHSIKQSKFSDKFMDYIIPIENPNLQEINAKTGLNLSLDKYQSSHHTQYLESYYYYVGNLPFTKMERYPPYYCYYSPKTLELVEELYKEDIASYGYTLPKEVIDFI